MYILWSYMYCISSTNTFNYLYKGYILFIYPFFICIPFSTGTWLINWIPSHRNPHSPIPSHMTTVYKGKTIFLHLHFVLVSRILINNGGKFNLCKYLKLKKSSNPRVGKKMGVGIIMNNWNVILYGYYEELWSFYVGALWLVLFIMVVWWAHRLINKGYYET